MAQQDNNVPGTGSGNVYLDSLIWGCGWDMTEGPITVWFGEGKIPDIPGVVGLPWTQDELDAFTVILDNYEAVCGLDFEIVDSYAEADTVEWKLDQSFFEPGALGRHEVPDETFAQTYGYYNSDADGWGNFEPGSDVYYTLVHELGHAVGLAHPHDGGGEADATVFPGVTSPFDTGDNELNQAIWTVMSYNRGWDDVSPPGDLSYGTATTLMAFDIAALQYLYGANMTYNTGNDTYVLPTVNAPGTGWSCIWDAGGTDTISNSGSALACSIDLNDAPLTGPNAAGFVSRALGITGGFTIANGALIENAVGGSNNDTLIGNELANILTGGTGNDTLNGGGGNDRLDGGTEADAMTGENGDDTYVVDNAGDTASEAGGSGTDLVQSAVTFSLASGIENLTLTGTAAINGTGNTGVNAITGNSAANVLSGLASNDTLTGFGGNDRLDGGANADAMSGGNGDDTYVVDNAGDTASEAGGSGTDLVQSAVTFSLASGIENLTLTGSAAINGTGNTSTNAITGNSGANILSGLAGNDTLTGFGGNDRLDGGANADTMIGGNGDDTYVVDNAGDTASEAGGGGIDLVQSAVTFTLGTGVDNLTLTGATAINGTGNASVNTITGNSAANTLSGLAANDTLNGFGGNDRLDGGTNADTMAGGNGDDTYVVDNAGDTASETGGSGTDSVQSTVTFTLAAGIENLALNGAAAINGTGNASANTMSGTSAVNRLDGNGANDTLTGFGGADVFVFDDGDGADTVTDFQNGSDRCDLTAVAAVDEFSDLVLTDTGAGVEVDYGTGSFELANIANPVAIDATDFVFA